ncbi:NAD(P)/FAD-dependent oxidoreductase [Bacillus infantis]|uniref:flavin-containing monooxygenase n=1 Tax=Bacillus infantis TaxID=324767 RepID=UPI001CD3DEC4|nr:NAD(P)/FAD-dependent oxidoreductase [Bacillus infantis]MCA1037527.1 NAD(P)/FAD-dependent oxidoreductase [Bacillus infantis]
MIYDVVIVGAGQAGLAMGYHLKQTSLSFLILDKGKEIGQSWKERYDSLTLFTPYSHSSLPGLAFKGAGRYPAKDEVAEYLSAYANTFSLPVKLHTTVSALTHDNQGHFVLATSQGELYCRNVIVATGPFHHPNIPSFSAELSAEVFQLHSSEYKNPAQLKDGATLVVGGGNSGAQIAAEVSKTSQTYLSVGHSIKYLPQDIGGKSIFWWFDKLGIYKADASSRVGQFIKNNPDPIFGYELKELIKRGAISLKPRTTSAKEDHVFFEDGSFLSVSNLIWSTGFKSDYRWIDIPSILDEKGLPVHQRGETAINGLYFLGLPWQHSRGSALLQGVGVDAEYIVERLLHNR